MQLDNQSGCVSSDSFSQFLLSLLPDFSSRDCLSKVFVSLARKILPVILSPGVDPRDNTFVLQCFCLRSSEKGMITLFVLVDAWA